jgi:hypothetical protein
LENQIRQTMTKKLSLVAIMPDSDQIVGLIIVDVKVLLTLLSLINILNVSTNVIVIDLKVIANVRVVEFR